VLGVIRPTVEILGEKTKNGHIGVLGTAGTIQSQSYPLEISKFFPDFRVTGEACPMWVPLVENREHESEGADYFIRKNIDNLLCKDPAIDTIILGCTHYPLLIDKIRKYTPAGIEIISQGTYIAQSLQNYLQRHPEIDIFCTKNGQTAYYSTESATKFEETATIFLNKQISAQEIGWE
jgi:glutamate racemase